MAWTETTRARYERHSGRYASDLTDQQGYRMNSWPVFATCINV